jgi:serine protease AprX
MSLKQYYTVNILLLLFPAFLVAQNRYWVSFTDKKEALEMFSPTDFLSEASLNRREGQNLDVQTNDYPVSPSYKSAVSKLGYHIYSESRWLNAVSIYLSSTNDVNRIKELSFVKSVSKVKTYFNKSSNLNLDNYSLKQSNTEYGPSFSQLAQLNGQVLHEQGFKGAGVTIAVIDASFHKVDSLLMFDHLWNNNKILDTWDFVLNQDLDFSIDTIGYHGTMVLSCMGAYMPDSLIGTAPDASYLLYRTEDTSSETLLEEDNWVFAAEKADAFGADIINTSLGYSILDDSLESHSYSDMDGNTTVITIAADIAASKGMLVVNSAGNSGTSDWFYITAPADGDSVLTIGAVDSDSIVTSFSSRGPTSDGRMKPNIVAQGLNAVVCNLNNGIRTANGTSFSSPILAGMAASTWSALPLLSSMDLFELIQESGHLYPNGNNEYGFGVPNFGMLIELLSISELPGENLKFYPNPVSDFLFLDLDYFEEHKVVSIAIYNVLGEKVFFESRKPKSNLSIDLSELPANSIYILKAQQGLKEAKCRLLK